jgi:hypothetical protein
VHADSSPRVSPPTTFKEGCYLGNVPWKRFLALSNQCSIALVKQTSRVALNFHQSHRVFPLAENFRKKKNDIKMYFIFWA